MTPRKPAKRAGVALPVAKPSALISDVRELILQAREGVARAVDSGLTSLYWYVDRRIRQDILREKRAEYGEVIVSALRAQLEAEYGQEILQSLSPKLTSEFGQGYSARNLASMVRFAEVFPDRHILQSLIAKLGWTLFQLLIYLDESLKRGFFSTEDVAWVSNRGKLA